MRNLSRRSLFQLAGLTTAAGAGVLASQKAPAGAHQAHAVPPHPGGHAMGVVGRVTSGIFNPTTFLRA